MKKAAAPAKANSKAKGGKEEKDKPEAKKKFFKAKERPKELPNELAWPVPKGVLVPAKANDELVKTICDKNEK